MVGVGRFELPTLLPNKFSPLLFNDVFRARELSVLFAFA